MGHKIPVDECRSSDGENGGNEVGDRPVCDPLHRRPRPLRLLHQGYDRRQDSVFAHSCGLEGEGPVLVEGASDYFFARLLQSRNRLPGDHGLVHVALSVHDEAVRGNLLARLDQDQVVHLNLLCGHLDLPSVLQNGGPLGLQAHQFLDGLRRAAFGVGLQIAAQRQEGGQHNRSLIEHELRSEHNPEGSQDAGAVGDANAHAVHDVHVQTPVLERPYGCLEDGIADIDEYR